MYPQKGNTMALVHSYTRFSHPSQAQGDSLRRQQELALAWIKKNNHTLSNLAYTDLGKSAFKGNKQTQLDLLLEAIKQGKIKAGDILLVEHIDRLSRKGIRPTQDLINWILNQGVDIAILFPLQKLYLAKEHNDIGAAIELAAFAYQAYLYSDLLSNRIKNWWDGARQVAEKTGKRIPSNGRYWLTKTENGFKVDNDKANIVKFIFQRCIDGLGVPSIVKELHQKFPPMSGKQNWNSVFVRQLLVERIVLGEYQPHKLDKAGKRVPTGEPIKNYFPAIIDEKTWQAAKASIANRRKETGASTEFINLFTGLLYFPVDQCAGQLYTFQQTRADGRKVIMRRIKSYHAKLNIPTATRETIQLDWLEDAVLSVLTEIDLSVFDNGNKTTIELQAKKGELQTKQKQLDKFTALMESDPIESLWPKLKKLETEIKEVKQEIKLLESKNTASPEKAVKTIERLSKLRTDHNKRQELREAIKQVVEKINLIPIKLGPSRRDTVATGIQICFTGGYHKIICLANGNSFSYQYDLPGVGRIKNNPLAFKNGVSWDQREDIFEVALALDRTFKTLQELGILEKLTNITAKL